MVAEPSVPYPRLLLMAAAMLQRLTVLEDMLRDTPMLGDRLAKLERLQEEEQRAVARQGGRSLRQTVEDLEEKIEALMVSHASDSSGLHSELAAMAAQSFQLGEDMAKSAEKVKQALSRSRS